MPIGAMAAIERGVIIREAVIYVAPDASAAKLSKVGRGREVAVVERSPGWANVVATVETDPDQETSKNVTGWVIDKGIVTPVDTPRRRSRFRRSGGLGGGSQPQRRTQRIRAGRDAALRRRG